MTDRTEPEVITIFRSKDQGTYFGSYCDDSQDYLNRVEALKERYDVFRAYAVDRNKSVPVVTLCEEFVSGTLTSTNGDSLADTLDDRIEMLRTEEKIPIRRIV